MIQVMRDLPLYFIDTGRPAWRLMFIEGAKITFTQ